MSALDLLEGVEDIGFERRDFGPQSYWRERATQRLAVVVSFRNDASVADYQENREGRLEEVEATSTGQLLVRIFEDKVGGRASLRFIDRAAFVDAFVRVSHSKAYERTEPFDGVKRSPFVLTCRICLGGLDQRSDNYSTDGSGPVHSRCLRQKRGW